MYRLFRLIFLGRWELPKEPEPCNHEWEQIRKLSGATIGGWHKEVYVLRCTKCGDIQKREID